MRSVELYFDYRSPYAYFANRDVPIAVARTPFAARWHPVSIHILLNLQIGRDPWADYVDPLPPVKRKYLMTDVVRGGQQRGLPINMPKSLNSLGALAISLKLAGSPGEPQFRQRVWRAMWEEGKDVSDPAVLAQLCEGLDIAALDAGEAKATIAAASAEAFGKGVFGVPTFLLDGEVFFGADRLDALEWRLGRLT